MSKELNILYQFDENYAPYAGISLLSLFENNKDIDKLNIYCAMLDVADDNIEKLQMMASRYNRNIIQMDVEKAMCQINEIGANTWNGSLATWIKIFIIEQLIGKIDQLLYIDSDTLVEGSLAELCDFDFEEKSMACVVDSLSFQDLHRLGIEKNKYYYNAGVMLYDLKYFAEHENYYSNMIVHLKKNVHRYLINDQDLLNDYFCGNIKKISLKYNFQGIHYMYSDKAYFKVYGRYAYYSKEEIATARSQVCIIHFFRALGDYPWVEGNYHPLKERFEYWKAKSLWKDIPALKKKRRLIFRIERVLYRCLPEVMFLGLFKWIREHC